MHPFTRYIFQYSLSNATKGTFELFLTLDLLFSFAFVAFELTFTLFLFEVRCIAISVNLNPAITTLYWLEEISFNKLEFADLAASLFLYFFDIFTFPPETH